MQIDMLGNIIDREYKVVTYTDHKQDDFVKYFDDYDAAYKHYVRTVASYRHAQWTAGSAIIHVKTNTTLLKKEWDVRWYSITDLT